ncbi:MAG: class I SAM-dependent methyltransferase [Cyanobacteriota bacterium]|nr:class I SAM-dependent methyltransferase [Cyanobacteriota bacterium]
MLHFFWTGYFLDEASYTTYESANKEIAKWAEYYLGQHVAFHQSLVGSGKVTESPHDILIGQPTFDQRLEAGFGRGKLLRNWVKDNALSQQDECHPNTFIFNAWVPQLPPEWARWMPYYESQLLAAPKILGLCGDIWYEKTLEKNDDSIEAQIKDKLTCFNMGLAINNFRYTKKSFNPLGERQLLHISHLGSYKGFDITCKSLLGLDVLLHVGSHAIPQEPGLIEYRFPDFSYSFNYLGSIDNSDPEFNQWVAESCDFYIHTATMDAQATVILENCARGLIPLVTPESGFRSDAAIYLTHDPEINRKIIDEALHLPESELQARSQKLREQIQREHNWKDIFEKIWHEISSHVKVHDQLGSIPPMSREPSIPSKSPLSIDERIYLSRERLTEIEAQIRLERHVERYALLRQFAKGVVCDAACGCGYGSYLMSKNPDVKKVIGLDMDEAAIALARQDYVTEKTEFYQASLDEWTSSESIDMLVTVETIEHIKDASVIPNFVERNRIKHVILTYPSKKTSHYNPYHHYDFRLQDILDLFPKFTCYKHFNWQYEFDVVFLLRNPEDFL